MGFSPWIHLDVAEIKRDTGKAFLLLLEDGSEHWLPRSVVSDPDDYDQGDRNCVVSVREWFAK